MAQLNSLIVTGDSRFLNTINGDITGDAGTVGGHATPTSGDASATQVVLGNDSRLTNSRQPTSHTHGNIQNGGTLQTTDVAIASGDKLVVTDASDSNKVARTSISFDGSTATKCLTQKGTFESFTNNTGTITEVKTTAGAHTTIDVTSGVASFNVPTTAAHVGAAASSHSHGNIANGGTISSTAVAPASTDYLLISDTSSSGKIERGVAIGTGTTKFLREDGTWQTPAYPAVYNKTLKLQLGGTDKKSFTANSNTDVTANFVFTQNTPTSVTPKTVVISANYANGVLSFTREDSVTVTNGTKASLAIN